MTKRSVVSVAVAMLVAAVGCKKDGPSEASIIIIKISEFADEMCTCGTKPCADRVKERLARWSDEHRPKLGAEPVQPREGEVKEMSVVVNRYVDCMTTAMTGVEPPAERAVDAGPFDSEWRGSMPSACAEYKRATIKVSTCATIPVATRDALQQSYERSAEAWRSIAVEGHAALEAGCKASVDATNQILAGCD